MKAFFGCGEHDIDMEHKAVDMWKKTENNCSVVVFKGAGHCVNLDIPGKFNEVIEKLFNNDI